MDGWMDGWMDGLRRMELTFYYYVRITFDCHNTLHKYSPTQFFSSSTSRRTMLVLPSTLSITTITATTYETVRCVSSTPPHPSRNHSRPVTL